MYESPINAFYYEMITKVNESFDNGILEAVTRVNINVDRDELIKALSYDRGQYDKGFSDGLEEGKPKWISVEDRLPEDDENLHFYDDGHLRFTSVLVRDKERGTDIANRLMIRNHSIPILDELATDGWVWSRPYEPTHWMPLPEPPKEE